MRDQDPPQLAVATVVKTTPTFVWLQWRRNGETQKVRRCQDRFVDLDPCAINLKWTYDYRSLWPTAKAAWAAWIANETAALSDKLRAKIFFSGGGGHKYLHQRRRTLAKVKAMFRKMK